jgi:hypothetical protein
MSKQWYQNNMGDKRDLRQRRRVKACSSPLDGVEERADLNNGLSNFSLALKMG